MKQRLFSDADGAFQISSVFVLFFFFFIPDRKLTTFPAQQRGAVGWGEVERRGGGGV